MLVLHFEQSARVCVCVCVCVHISFHLQLSISRVQFCSSRGYRLRSIIQAAVVVILEKGQQENRERRVEKRVERE